MTTKSVKLCGTDIPIENIIEIKPIEVAGVLRKQIKYSVYDDGYHEITTTLSWEKGYALEKKVRKAMIKH